MIYDYYEDDVSTSVFRHWENHVVICIAEVKAQLSAGTSKNMTWRMVEITQDESRGWTPEVILEFLKWSAIKDYAWIRHDKDFKEDCKTPRDPHNHVLVRFHDKVHTSTLLYYIARLGCVIPFSYLNKIKSWNAALNYLTHRDVENAPYKHIYDVSDVRSNFDWESCADTAHAQKQVKVTPARIKEICDSILSGDIRRYNVHEHTTGWERIKGSKEINNAFREFDSIFALGALGFKSETLFITGGSGFGKDFYAEHICDVLGKPFARASASSDLLSNYHDEPALIVSDARDSLMSFNNMLQFLDPNRRNYVHSRYNNKLPKHDLLIMTSVTTPDSWFLQYRDTHKDDSISQLYRRIPVLLRIDTYVDIEYPDYIERVLFFSILRYFPDFQHSRHPYKVTGHYQDTIRIPI